MIKLATVFSACAARLRAFAGDRRGNIAIMAGVLLPVMAGGIGLGSEVVSWYAMQRSMQGAADSAAIAAATNSGADFDLEAKAVARKYGYVNGVDGVTVTALDEQTCPNGDTNCFRVNITKTVPVMIAQVVNYQGDTQLSGGPAKRLAATALAIQAAQPRPYCIVALASSGVSPAIRTNGAPKADLSGCNVLSNSGATCNGHDLDADNGDAHDTNNGCGNIQHSNVDKIADQYAARASNIPSHNCGGYYPVAPQKKNDPPLPGSNVLSGYYAWDADQNYCGDVQLTGPTVIETNGHGLVLYIRNGMLDTNGYSLSTSNGSSLTIVFTGTSGNYQHIVAGGGTLDFNAPDKGPWSGVAIYQDPALTQNVDMEAGGNMPTWDITGLVYMPHASVTFSGAVNKSSNGKSCFVLVVDNLLINGTAQILGHGECRAAGLTMPANPVPNRGKLVS